MPHQEIPGLVQHPVFQDLAFQQWVILAAAQHTLDSERIQPRFQCRPKTGW